MRRRPGGSPERRTCALCLLGFLLSGCGGLLGYLPLGSSGSHEHECPAAGAVVVDRGDEQARVSVVVISIDGLRPDFVTPDLMPNLARLRAEGVSAREARTVRPSQTLPSHISMWTGVPVTTHGVDWNDDRTEETGPVGLQTAFGHARAAGRTTGALVGKNKLRHLFRPGTLHVAEAPDGGGLGARVHADIHGAMSIADRAGDLFRATRPDLTFLHFADPDAAGHVFGWGGRAYRRAVRQSDRALHRVLGHASCAFGDDVVVIVTADHGGEGRTHAIGREVDVRIPWIAWGPRLEPRILVRSVRTCDTGATALALLAVEVPAAWEGIPLLTHEDAFGPVVVEGGGDPDRCR